MRSSKKHYNRQKRRNRKNVARSRQNHRDVDRVRAGDSSSPTVGASDNSSQDREERRKQAALYRGLYGDRTEGQ